MKPTKPTDLHAQALGRLGAGKPKNFTPEERERRRVRLIAMNKARAKAK